MTTRLQTLLVSMLAAATLAACAGKAVRPMPVTPLHELMSDEDYPVAAMRYEQEGKASVTLTIDETGKVSDCRVEQSSGHTALDEATCELLVSRAQFTPARDAKGRAIAGSFVTAIAWVLPPETETID